MENRVNNLRNISSSEQSALIARGCNAASWSDVWVSDDFCVDQLSCVRFAGRVELSSGVHIFDSYVSNYAIGEGSRIEGVTRLECRHASSFGNGTVVNTINENGGRRILLYDVMSAQVAYIWAINRHREGLDERFTQMVEAYSAERRSTIGHIGSECTILGAKFIREVSISDRVTIEGASLLESGTILDGAYVGVDTQAREFIIAEDGRFDSGATVERCFIGERAIVASGFSAVDSLIFSSSHLENGEAAAIFAGAYTVSHHKSSLLIAGLFSFFNAGSGSNQSNHLFKCGAVHQAIHSRGCKFASGAYVMAPAREGAFTMVKGHHSRHHDTSAFPYSYLIDDASGRSMLMPGANLVSYGTLRDIEKWEARDNRTVRRDVINYEEHNPYITGAMIRAVNTIHTLTESPKDEYSWERVFISAAQLRRGLGLYNKAIAASLGAMLSRGVMTMSGDRDVRGEWLDVAGAYLPATLVEELIDDILSGRADSLRAIQLTIAEFSVRYADYAHAWAYDVLEQLLGHEPSDEEVLSTIESSKGSAAELARQRESDRLRDCSLQMAVGYGNDSHDESIREADFRAVRDL